MKVFLTALYAQIFLNAYIFWRGYQALPPGKTVRIPFILIFAVELSLYFTGYIFHKDLPDTFMYLILLICNTWYIASLYIAMGLIALEVTRFILRRCSGSYGLKVLSAYTLHKSRIKLSLFIIFIAVVTGLMVNGYGNAVNPVVRYVDVRISKPLQDREQLTVAMMSDLHIGEFVGKKNVQRFVELCNAEHPDMVIINGDIIDYESRQAEQWHIEDDLQQLRAPLGVYLTLGNHEYRANRMAKIRWLNKTGGILLKDSVVLPDSTFYLIGRDDAINRKRASLETLLKGVDMSKPVIVIDHQPGAAREVIDNQCDLGLFGHTHNGQYWPAPLLLKLAFEFPYGYYVENDTHLYVSSGIGFAGQPYRIGTRSELVVLRITGRR
ncbi:MAG: metallophosphoesterase [Tannerella sp.]|jgi:predicted MPP superfamily phosphohydrolase|nr:metallophosphoesterase [Tannerella sp.]